MTYAYYRLNNPKINPAPTGREEDGAKVPGLSTCHNCTLSHGLFYVGGQLMKVSRNFPTKEGQEAKSKRKPITEFSKKSRRRMMQMIAKINVDEPAYFGTLTLPDEFHDLCPVNKGNQAKRFERNLRERIRRKFPKISYFQRIEFMPRKSGKYPGVLFPHFHLMIYNIEDFHNFRSWLTVNWYQVCGKISSDHLKAGISLEKMRSAKGAMHYMSKYLAKDAEYFEPCGRVWLVHNAENLPFVKGILMLLSEQEAVILIRYMRRFIRRQGHDYKSLTIFTNVDFWWRRLPEILHPT
jgi:hypothetical protein